MQAPHHMLSQAARVRTAGGSAVSRAATTALRGLHSLVHPGTGMEEYLVAAQLEAELLASSHAPSIRSSTAAVAHRLASRPASVGSFAARPIQLQLNAGAPKAAVEQLTLASEEAVGQHSRAGLKVRGWALAGHVGLEQAVAETLPVCFSLLVVICSWQRWPWKSDWLPCYSLLWHFSLGC